VKEMQHIENPELPALNLEKAIKVTHDYMTELEELKSEGLTEKQATTLIKFTKELISPTETEI
jgi:hypothetical protein